MNRAEIVELRDRKAAEAAALEPPKASCIGDDVATFVGDLQRMVAVMPLTDDQALTCPALLADEVECRAESHLIRSGWSRPCSLIQYRAQLRELRPLVEVCLAGRPLADPVGDALRDSLSEQRPVEGLALLIATLDKVRARGFRGVHGHVGFAGTRGTAKTHALLCLHFSALWRGVSSTWVTTQRLVEIARGRSSFDAFENGKAEGKLRDLRRSSVLCFDDLGDRVSDHRAESPGVTTVAGVLLDVLNGYTGRVFLSSNLNSAELAGHPDIGPRVVSRLLADHRGVPAMGVRLAGRDQRRHAARFLERTQVDA